ncbi:hypothetical protein D6833_06010, partial [Candidatus Parcubacteria bacterium]
HAIQLSDAVMICHYDGPQPYETDFSGDLTGHMGQVGTATGGVIFRPGKFGKAVQVAEATTNYVLNPVSGGSGNITARGSATVTIGSTDTGYLATTSTKVVTTASGDGVDYTLSALANAAHTVSVALDVTGLTTLECSLDGSTWHALTEQYEFGGWYIYTATAIPAVECNGSTTLAIRQTDAAARTVYIGAAQVEQKSYPTPFAHGDMGDGHTWSGTAHASTSDRVIAKLSYDADVLDANEGTVMLWVIPLMHLDGTYAGSAPSYADILTLAWIGTGRFNLETDATVSGIMRPRWNYDGGPLAGYYEHNIIATSENHYAFVWSASAGYTRLYHNGVLVAENSSFAGWGGDGTVLSFNRENKIPPVLIDDLAVLSSALDADTIRAIYESGAPVFAESSSWGFRA